MEAVRCERGVGVFANFTYCQLLTALVSSAAVKPEVRGVLCRSHINMVAS